MAFGVKGAPRISTGGGRASNLGGVRFQKSVRPPTNFPHVSVTRRDYAKPEMGSEQPLGVSEGQKSNFAQTGLTGES